MSPGLASLAMTVVIAAGLAACAPPRPGPAPADPGQEDVQEPSAFARDPAQTHIMSPDQPDLHPAEPPPRYEVP